VTAIDLLADLARQGFSLIPEGDGIRVTPASRLTGELRQAVMSHKPALLAQLRSQGLKCRGCGRSVDEKGRCWRCCNRPCVGCGRPTGTAFIQRCTTCGLAFNGNRGEPL